ncbi:hypothetical protein QBC43DRAFT_108774 [Cladorrhinum sp. PSN259]|nr:hypothetical protein QBC43DRAFT_108774 [Cladorrhinum sp. PSN259]
MAPGSSRSSRSSIRLSQPMPMIIEDVADTSRPHVPPKSPNRRSMGPPPVVRSNSNRSLRSLSGTPLATIPGGAPKSEAPSVLQKEGRGTPTQPQPSVHGAPLTPRKGWYRSILAALLLTGVIVGLSVGLTIGLRKRKSSSKRADIPLNLFPAGSFSFTTALSNISTSCTSSSLQSSSQTWKCFPYALLQPATYHWTISAPNSHTFIISSSPPARNPFAPAFQNITMKLVDGNQYTERLTFSVPIPKAVSAEVETQGGKKVVATCWFNSTVLSATLWTRVRASFPENITSVVVPANTAAPSWSPWPFAVEVSERTRGADKGECRDSRGNVVAVVSGNGTSTSEGGGEADGNEQQPGGECGCGYKNFDLGGESKGNGTAAATASRRRRGRI